MQIKDTIEMMNSADYKERFRAEYWQTKIRYEKLKDFNTKIEAARHLQYFDKVSIGLQMPPHECPDLLLTEQQNIMGQYLHVLEVRAEIEGIALYQMDYPVKEEEKHERKNLC